MSDPDKVTVSVAVPVEWTWHLLSAPQCWPWLVGSAVSVEFTGRANGRTRYRLGHAGTDCDIETIADPTSFTMEVRCGERTVLTCAVASAGELSTATWALWPEAPAPVAEFWRKADACAPTIEKTSHIVEIARTYEDPLDKARALAPISRGRAQDSLRARTLDPAVVAALRECGIFRIGLPRSLGGADLSGRTVVAVIEELSRANAATGWCAFIGNQNAYAAWLPPKTLARMSGENGSFVLAGSTAVTGTAEPSGDGHYRLNGRWRFNSGCLHADWIMAGVTVPADDGTRVPRLAFVPWRKAEVLDTWHVAGLAGTGSHDIVLNDVDVPADFIAPLFTEPSQSPDPLHRLSPYNIQGVLMIGLPLGLARRALDELTALMSSPTVPWAEETAIEFARLETALAAARALALDTVDEYWEELSLEPQLAPRSAARLALVLRQAVDTAKHVIEQVSRSVEHVGSFETSRTLRGLLRDCYGAGQHLAVSDDVYRRNALRLVGHPDAT
ncbi:acyl-CoA dehydrogenase family protein [Saccharomonospora sp.]|uniref:acyl-CoA dehydrogenase family protein n=1 Tax=Saccharomonospora sp. TaxID=33913 RepID=UPI002613D557|nr:acyl-CoA dehydrogenase family protein [Saccharomonospora sp.]